MPRPLSSGSLVLRLRNLTTNITTTTTTTTPHRRIASPPPSSSSSLGFGNSYRTQRTSAIREENIRSIRRLFTTSPGRERERERLYLGKAAGSPERLDDEMADRIHRVTMFKIADEGQRKRLIEQYKVLGSSHKKDGKPYILSMVVGPAADDPRSQGFTVVAKTEFASLADMKYYDDECAAHGELKAFVKENLDVGGVMSVYFKPEAVASL